MSGGHPSTVGKLSASSFQRANLPRDLGLPKNGSLQQASDVVCWRVPFRVGPKTHKSETRISRSAPSAGRPSLQGLIRCPRGMQPTSGITSASPSIAPVARARDNLHLLVKPCAQTSAREFCAYSSWTDHISKEVKCSAHSWVCTECAEHLTSCMP